MTKSSGNSSNLFIGTDSLSAEYLTELGRITAYLSILEFCMINEIARLSNLDPITTLMMFAGDQYERILKVLTSVFYHRISNKQYCKEFDSIRGELDSINSERNTQLHAIWSNPTKDNATRTRFSKKDRKNKGCSRHPINKNDLKKISDRMVVVQHILSRFIDKVLKV